MSKIKALAVLGIVCFTLIGLAPVASAQSGNASTTPTPESSVIDIDSHTSVVEYEFNENTLRVVFKSDFARTIKISDMFVGGSGANRIPTKTTTINKGKTTITFEVTTWKNYHGASIATTNGAIAISEQTGGGELFTNSYAGETTMLLMGSGFVGGIGLVGIIAYKRELEISSEIKREL